MNDKTLVSFLGRSGVLLKLKKSLKIERKMYVKNRKMLVGEKHLSNWCQIDMRVWRRKPKAPRTATSV